MNNKICPEVLFAVAVVTLTTGCMFTTPPQDVSQRNVLSDCVYERSALIGTWRQVGSYNWAWGNGYEPIPEESQDSRISFEINGTFRSFRGNDEIMAVPFLLVRKENPLNHEITCLLQIGVPGNTISWDFSFDSGDTLTLATPAADAGASVYVRDY